MSEQTRSPYEQYTGTTEWAVLDKAVSELVRNSDLQEKTAHRYIVGYLCQALNQREADAVAKPKRSREELEEIFAAARAEFSAVNPTGRDLVAELSAERREAAALGD